jgi:hypothetical protein
LCIDQILWDLDDDPDGNVQHVAEHGLTVEEVEEALFAATEVLASNSSGLTDGLRQHEFRQTHCRRF